MSIFLRPALSCQLPQLNELLDQYFPGCQGGVFVEVGANDGYSWSNTWALAELGWCGLYFEPVKELADRCREKHKNNAVIVINAAVGEFTGETKLYLGQGCTTSPFVAEKNVFLYGNSPDNWITVPCFSLNDALKQHKFSANFELLVIDVDGDELGVLDGLDLDIWKPTMIIIETSKDTKMIGWDFNATGIDARLLPYYDEVYHDHINSVYVRSSTRKKALPMPSLFDNKKQALLKYAGGYNCSLFVETGTGGGDMLDAVYPYFKQSFSVELDDGLYQNAVRRFKNAGTVHVFHGDSGEVLPQILASLDAPALFYLDAHYSGPGTGKGAAETPILTELKVILGAAKFNSVILIDDYKDFANNPAYPKPDALKQFISDLRLGLKVEILSEGGGMFLITPAKKKFDPSRKVQQVIPRRVEPSLAPVSERRSAQEPADENENRKFERPPMLYGPYREGKKGDFND